MRKPRLKPSDCRLDSLVTVDLDFTPARVEQLVASTGYSRFPVQAGDRTPTGADLIGYVHIADVLDTDQARRNIPLDHRWIRPLGEIRAPPPCKPRSQPCVAAAHTSPASSTSTAKPKP